MKQSIIFGFTILSTSLAVNAADNQWDAYYQKASQAQQQIDAGKLQEASVAAKELVAISKSLLPEVVMKKPICKAYLSAAISAADQMLTITVDEIERDYHADGKLPPVKDAACYHAKDLLVHPATVVVLAANQAHDQKTQEQMHHEIEEVLEHFGQVKQIAQ
ncbi:hypothetical protein [Thalassotalea fusca]